MNALSAEASALARLVERDTAEGGQIIDQLQVTPGYEKALGAALADDLRAPEVGEDGPSGWASLPAYRDAQALPAGVEPTFGACECACGFDTADGPDRACGGRGGSCFAGRAEAWAAACEP